jgi:hypothetical protein
MHAPDYTVTNNPPRMSQSPDVAADRQFAELLFYAAQCAANCEPGHSVDLIERLTSTRLARLSRAYKNRAALCDAVTEFAVWGIGRDFVPNYVTFTRGGTSA